MNLKPSDEWLLKEKVDTYIIIDSLKDTKTNMSIRLYDEDVAKISTDKNEIIDNFNQVFAVLAEHGVYLKAQFSSTGNVHIIRIGKKYAEDRARNLKDKISEEYRKLIVQKYENRFKKPDILPKGTPPSKTPMKESVNKNPIETPPEDIEIDRAGLEDRGGTRSAAKG